jgi:hypothetical protein
MKLLLPLAHYYIIYLIIKLFQINLMFIWFENCSIFIGPFINTPSTTSWISNILNTRIKPMLCWTPWILVSTSTPNPLEISHP